MSVYLILIKMNQQLSDTTLTIAKIWECWDSRPELAIRLPVAHDHHFWLELILFGFSAVKWLTVWLEHAKIVEGLSFSMPEAVVKGELRPLRNPADDTD